MVASAVCFPNHSATDTTYDEGAGGCGFSHKHSDLEEVIVMSASRRFSITCCIMV